MRTQAAITSGSVGSAPDADALPQLAARDQRGLDDLGVAGGELGSAAASRASSGSAITARRLVVGADVVLGLGEVDAGLAAVRRVDLRDERRRHLHVADAALVGGGAEARQIADHAAAERDDEVRARHPCPRQLGPHDLGVGDGLRLLAGHDRDPPGERLERVAVQAPDVAVGDEEAAARRPSAARSRARSSPRPM